RLVANGKLPDQTCRIRKCREEFRFRAAEVGAEKLVQLRFGGAPAAHELSQAAEVVLYIPIVNVRIVLRGVIASALAAGELWIKRLDPVSISVFGPDKAFVLSEHILVVGRAFEEKPRVLLQVEHAGDLRRAPIIIALLQRHGNCLAPLKWIHLRN